MSGCDRCGRCDENRLYATVDGTSYCSECWRKAGRPWPRRRATVQEIAQAEINARGRMLKRGGNARHMVRSGKS